MRPAQILAPALVLAGALVSSGEVQARNVSVSDGFEKGNAGNWIATGQVNIVQAQNTKASVQAHAGKSYVVLVNPLPFPGTSLTNTVTVNARKGDPCSLELWVHAPGKTGALMLSVRDGFPTGAILSEKKAAAPTLPAGKASKGYSLQRLNFAHTGRAFFVAIHAIGPVEAAIDDFNLTCRTR